MTKFLRQLWCRFYGHQEYVDVNCPTPPDWYKPKWVCKCCGEEYLVTNKEVSIDDMTPEMYNSISPPERFLWAKWWNCQGVLLVQVSAV